MGTTCTVFHVWKASTDSVCNELGRRGGINAYVSPADNGWVTFVEQTADRGFDDAVCLAGEISLSLQTAVLVLLEADSDYVIYYIFDCGREIDRYVSSPENMELSSAEAQAWRGVPGKILPYCVAGTTEDQIEAILRQPHSVPGMTLEQLNALKRKPPGGKRPRLYREDDRIRDLATIIFGLRPTRTTLVFRDFDPGHLMGILRHWTDIASIHTLADAARVFVEQSLPGKESVADWATFRFVGGEVTPELGTDETRRGDIPPT